MTDLKGKLYVAVVDDESRVLKLTALQFGSLVGNENVYKAGNVDEGAQLAQELYSDKSKRPIRWYIDGLEGGWRNMISTILQNGGHYSEICLFTSRGDFIKEANILGIKAVGKTGLLLSGALKADLEAYWQGLSS